MVRFVINWNYKYMELDEETASNQVQVVKPLVTKYKFQSIL